MAAPIPAPIIPPCRRVALHPARRGARGPATSSQLGPVCADVSIASEIGTTAIPYIRRDDANRSHRRFSQSSIGSGFGVTTELLERARPGSQGR